MLHELLSRSRDEIIVRCEEKLRARHPDRPPDELLDTIPQFIDELIKAERREAGWPEDTPLPAEAPFAREHGEQRFRRGYPPSCLPLDYGTISETIGELAIENNLQLDARSYKLLNACIDKAIAHSITQYFTLSRESDDMEIAEWVGSLGHELRNAVATALMAYEALRSGQVGIASRTSHVLERALRRVEMLVGQTLAAAHLRSGLEVKRFPTRLRDLVDDIVESAVVERAVKIGVDVEPGLEIEADAHLLESALSNLVQNAIKYTRPGGRVQVRATGDTSGVTIEVTDECGGLGDNTERLFSAFVRGATGKGVGLGLSITRQSIEAHGGHVTVSDRAPVGCAFRVWLPRTPG